MKIPSKKTGLKRVISAIGYSISGIKSALKSEAAFRQEVFLFLILAVVVFILPFENTTKMILLFANTLVLIVELLNTAIEKIVDLASPTYHELAKQSKDIASSAVFISIALSSCLWIFSLINAFKIYL
jgi:diacylglycerol kinase (ATP)